MDKTKCQRPEQILCSDCDYLDKCGENKQELELLDARLIYEKSLGRLVDKEITIQQALDRIHEIYNQQVVDKLKAELTKKDLEILGINFNRENLLDDIASLHGQLNNALGKISRLESELKKRTTVGKTEYHTKSS